MPRKLSTEKIQVKAFAALPFLEDRIPPELVEDEQINLLLGTH